jgi:predicted aldo/keto reductase-like oxidoreductase
MVPEFVTSGKFDSVVSVIAKSIDEISNDSLIKIVRQLEFWTKEKLPEEELLTLTEQLVHTSLWRKRFPNFQVPKVRFGKTELQMPIVTCGSMRFQHTWMPDVIPVIGASRTKAVKTPSQANILEIVRNCLKMGINHFETCRYYGTSEVQLMDALAKLLESGEIKRSDFILQTKIPVKETREGFEKDFAECWKIFEKLEYIDLLSFWCVSSPSQVKYSLDESETSCMAAALEWKQQGKIKHIGFSSHGNAGNIMELINSNSFEYMNIHYHFFGSYHAEGTPASVGGHGNLACVKRALELDMGVFNISPVDKGGRLYQPSATVARTVGPKLTPIAFAALHVWETAGMHTASVGFARPEDLDEILQACELFTRKQEMKKLLDGAESRLLALAEKRLGKEWLQKGMNEILDFYDESTKGVALGHTLWCHNMLIAYDMYDTAKNRYEKLETTNKWDNKKSFEENSKKM